MTKVTVVDGDITQIKADALITAINSSGLWWGGIDSAIQRVSGTMFHKQAAAQMPLRDGQVIFAPATLLHNGRFDNVIFVIDELERSVDQLVRAALDEADARSLATVSIPTLRTGVMVGVYETHGEALGGLAIAIDEFVRANPSHIQEISVVVYNNSADKNLLAGMLNELASFAQ
jgi:O-acetyl-ADP-ribose deacetylase (regulator of RNase III)